MYVEVENLRIPVRDIEKNARDIDNKLRPYIAEYCSIVETEIADIKVISKSIDARKKGWPVLTYKVQFRIKNAVRGMRNFKEIDASTEKKTSFLLELDPKNKVQNPIVVGTGPAGLLAAWMLAYYGMKPIVIDCGTNVEQRHEDITNFKKTRELNENSNYLYGEGGAGTYSDGKLYTRKKDDRIKFVIDLFIKYGAPKKIGIVNRPHIGSDKLRSMVAKMREEIISLGGEYRWNCKVTDIIVKDNQCYGVKLESGETLESEKTILAFGLSSRDLIEQLIETGVDHELKDFQIGTRIEHRQELIDRNQYGMDFARHESLPPAEYNFVSRPQAIEGINRVSTFCMCPGGTIVPATAERGMLSTNGMSNFARNNKFANSCLIVNQKSDCFATTKDAFKFLRDIESAAFVAGGSDYTAPGQDASAFIKGQAKFLSPTTSYCFGIKPFDLNEILPGETADSIAYALNFFERKCKGFMKDGKLIGVETHISSPVRFTRDFESMQTSVKNLYIAGEGAGYAGGIMSAAIDGLKIAEKIILNEN
ncbi:FAD-dependent protein [Lentisphaerota bacterium WC36G]|nr:NAD(P)/FAD-dependent oxidoreductase [Lentisphaerae bacterium WC36]